MAKISETYIRQAFLARFARMGRESQEAVIEAMETIRDGTNLPPEIAEGNGQPAAPLLDGLERERGDAVVERATESVADIAGALKSALKIQRPERTPGAATILGEPE